MTRTQQITMPGAEQSPAIPLTYNTPGLLPDEAADAPLNPYARVFVLSWLLGTLVAVGAPYLFH